MKILSKNKIIVSALALCIGASLAGSVSGTIAWYQYSTRANVAFIGEAGGFSGNLQMRFVSEASAQNPDSYWRTRITWKEMNDELTNTGYASQIVPMTYGPMSRNQALPQKGYAQPIARVSDTTKWVEASKKNYAQFQLQLRYNERDGVEEGNPAVDGKNALKEVYISKMEISEHAVSGKKDLSDAARVHISSSYTENETAQSVNKLVSNKGGTILTQGKLDLDGDGINDRAYPESDEFGFNDPDPSDPQVTTLQDVVYGSGVQSSYGNTATFDGTHTYTPYGSNTPVADPIHPVLVTSTGNKLENLQYNDGNIDQDKYIGKTNVGNASYLTVTVTIWIEGWQELDGDAIWNEVDYIGSKFNVGIQFAVQDAFAE